ncbi:MAG: serine protease, partial [Gemmatimonadota bacterium]
MGHAHQAVLYDADDRYNYYEVTPGEQMIMNSVALVADTDALSTVGGIEYLDTQLSGLCIGQKFFEEARTVGATPGTAFLIGDGLMLSARHVEPCAKDAQNQPTRAIIFRYQIENAADILTLPPVYSSVLDHDKYFCDQVVAESSDADWIVFTVDDPVKLRQTGRVPLDVRRRFGDLTGEPVVSAGHYSGFAQKFSRDGRVTSTSDGFFAAALDVGGGNSGAPILDADDMVAGVVLTGPAQQNTEPDPLLVYCDNWISCPASGCTSQTGQCPPGWPGCPASQFAIGVNINSVLDGLIEQNANVDLEYVVVLLDQTGSMSAPGMADGFSRWDDAISAAAALITLDGLSSYLPRAYSLWTFKRDAEQDGAEQVWPTPESTDCGDYDAETGFCRLSAFNDYVDVAAAVENLRESHRAVPDPVTPLAETLCESLDLVRRLPGRK